MADVSVDSGHISSVLPHTEQRTVKLILSGDNGIAFQNHGAFFDFNSNTLYLLHYQRAAFATRILSKDAAMSMFTNDTLGEWQHFFKELYVGHFHGQWSPQVLLRFLNLCPNLMVVSFTYFQCKNLNLAINEIRSKNLIEITAHVGRGQEDAVVKSIADLHLHGISLLNLMLIFSVPLSKSVVEGITKELAVVLRNDARIIFLFSGKTDGFNLAADGFEDAGCMRMAGNDMVSDKTPHKTYETYRCFQTRIMGRTYRIGYIDGQSKSAKAAPSSIVQSDVANANEYPSSCSAPNLWLKLKTNLEDPAWPHTTPIAMNQRKFTEPFNLKEYVETVPTPSSNYETIRSVSNFDMPGWKETRIQKIIFHEGLTEYLTTNGLYFKLNSMKEEPAFYRSNVCTKRLVISCRTHLRLHINNTHMEHFFRNTTHIEFTGDWMMQTLKIIAYKIPENVEELTMMRISFQRREPIREFFNGIHDNVKAAIKCFRIDIRDSACDKSIGSLYNGIRENLTNLREFIALSYEWEQPHYRCGFNKFVKDINGLVGVNGSVTIVVMKSRLKIEELANNGFANPSQTEAVLVYPPYQRQGHRNPSIPNAPVAPRDQSRLLMQFYKESETRHFYLIVPWNHDFARNINTRQHPNYRKWICPDMGY